MKTEKKRSIPNACRLFYFFIAPFFFSLLLSSCGFQLRGTGSQVLPESLATLRVRTEDSAAVQEPALTAVRMALHAAGGTVVETGNFPELVLFGERSDSQVLSVRAATGKAAEYLLTYSLSFRLLDVAGRELAPAQTVRLQRDHAFNPVHVLAKEQEERELRAAMQRDAAAQIVRRLTNSVKSP